MRAQERLYGFLMTPSDQVWPKELTRAIASQVREYRDAADLSAQEFADAVTALGLKYTRTQVTNLESGRRDTITIGEVLAFAAVLGRPPALLLFPIGTDKLTPLLPAMLMDAWGAYRAFIGDTVIAFDADRVTKNNDPVQDAYSIQVRDRLTNPIPLYREHDTAHFAYLGAKDAFDPDDTDGAKIAERYLSTLAATRIEIHSRGWTQPLLWPDTIKALTEPLLDRGYKQNGRGDLEEISSTPPS